MKILVTGNAGFIGFHTASKLLRRGDSVIGIDNLNTYYEVELKQARLKQLTILAKDASGNYFHEFGDIADRAAINDLFETHHPDKVIHLAAQAGVRHSIDHPEDYVTSNLVGFANILEACRRHDVQHLTYASTSSVYGANTKLPFSEQDSADHPIQFYAATKRANELMAHSYSHLFRLPTTGLRFFTVYGPWGRPDMALAKFTKSIIAGDIIEVYNFGNHSRDFTYVGDIVEGIIRISDQPAIPDPEWNSATPRLDTSDAPFRVYNIGNNNPVKLMEYIRAIETVVGKEARVKLLPKQPGDVADTYADTGSLLQAVGYKPTTTVEFGIQTYVEWFRRYYGA